MVSPKKPPKKTFFLIFLRVVVFVPYQQWPHRILLDTQILMWPTDFFLAKKKHRKQPVLRRMGLHHQWRNSADVRQGLVLHEVLPDGSGVRGSVQSWVKFHQKAGNMEYVTWCSLDIFRSFLSQETGCFFLFERLRQVSFTIFESPKGTQAALRGSLRNIPAPLCCQAQNIQPAGSRMPSAQPPAHDVW